MVQHKNRTQPSHNELATSNFATSSGIQWNLVNKDIKGTCQSVHIIWVSVLSWLFLEKTYEIFQFWDIKV